MNNEKAWHCIEPENGRLYFYLFSAVLTTNCFVTGVRNLRAYDNVYISTTYPRTKVDMVHDVSFFGLVQWSSHQPRDEL